MHTLTELLILDVLLGLIPAFIARHKGWPFVGWWIYGTVLFVIALPHAIFFLKPHHDARGGP
jgi:hypothetical protein